VGAGVAANVGAGVARAVAVEVGVGDAPAVGDGSGVDDGVALGVGDALAVGDGSGVGLGVAEGVALGVGEGVGLGVGEGVGLGVGDGVGLGVGVGTGGATGPAASLAAESESAPFQAYSTATMYCDWSALATTYCVALSLTSRQAADEYTAPGQLHHSYLACVPLDPRHAPPTAVSVAPTWATPLIDGAW
jgi:hypothetical protein